MAGLEKTKGGTNNFPLDMGHLAKFPGEKAYLGEERIFVLRNE
jgi:hypothetical protein